MCKVYKHLFSLGLELNDADCASILTDIDFVVLELNSESLFLSIISAKQVPPDRRSRFTVNCG